MPSPPERGARLGPKQGAEMILCNRHPGDVKVIFLREERGRIERSGVACEQLG